MKPNSEAYCLADPVFYDSHSRWGADSTTFAQAAQPTPTGWARAEQDVWVSLRPDGMDLPPQGWKIHVSACLDNAERVLTSVYDYCVGHRLAFKFLRSANVHKAHNLKYAPRAVSGKLVTIYPPDETVLHTVLTGLGGLLDGEPGPYILSDLRWGKGPLYVRYGGFAERHCVDDNGTLVLAVRRPDGTLVPDRRRPFFELPEWVTLPDFLAPHLVARNAGDPVDFPYQVESALHFSNAGGVYLARRADDGARVVLKEARPHTGVDGSGRDAVARLRQERDMLRALAGVPGVPELYEHRTVWEHDFLVLEHLPGSTLHDWLAHNYPLTLADRTPEKVASYTRRAIAIVDSVAATIRAIHDRGFAFSDLHPSNIIVDDAEHVALVDFELASPAADNRRPILGNPGFMSRTARGTGLDQHALAALRLWIFLPLTHIFELDPTKATGYLDYVAEWFPLPRSYREGLTKLLADADADTASIPTIGGVGEVDLTVPEPNWSTVCESIADAIVGSATPERTDRLFPGDIQQFVMDGFGFAYGAAGVLWALDVTGHGRDSRFEDWLCAAVRDRPPPRAGFYDGLHGLAYVFDHLGHHEHALVMLERAASLTGAMRDVSLFSGLAGVGLNLLHLGIRMEESDLRETALRIADRLHEAVGSGTPHGIGPMPDDADRGRPAARAGLLHGWSGVGLFFLRAYEHTGDVELLNHAVVAAHRDLDLCLPHTDGTLQVDDGFRLMSYLGIGSAGIALLAAEILVHRPDERLAASLPALTRACMPEFVIEPQLFFGRAGFIATLSRLAALRPAPELTDAVRRHLRLLSWYAISYRGRLAFPGDQLRRLSMDVATGGAGVLMAIAVANDPEKEFLPFLGSGSGSLARPDALSMRSVEGR